MRIIHLFPGRNHHHVPGFVKYFSTHFEAMGTSKSDHQFVVLDDWDKLDESTRTLYDARLLSSGELAFHAEPVDVLFDHILKERQDSALVMHGVFTRRIWLSLQTMPEVLSRVAWVIWGGELAGIAKVKDASTPQDHHLHLVHKFVIPKLGSICALAKGDFQTVESLLGPCNNHESVFYSMTDGVIDSKPETITDPSEPVSVLLGNSGASTNCHIEALEWLSNYRDENLLVFSPLGYGSKDGYAEEVVKAGNDLLGKKFIPMMENLPAADYFKFLDSIDVILFNHRRQQGVGNLFRHIARGRVAYLRQETPTWSLLRDIGIELRSTADISRLSFKEFVLPFEMSVQERNRELFDRHLSIEASVASWRKLFEKFASQETGRLSHSTGLTEVASISSPLITIGIATYNRADMIGDAIQSSLDQTGANWEILVADDGSIDSTEELIRSFNDPRIRYLNCEHRGTPSTRNSAIEAARGEFILWLDSDDALLPDTLERYTAEVKARPDVDVFYGDWINADADFQVTDEQKFENWDGRHAELLATMIWKSSIPHGGALIRKRIFIEAGGYDVAYPSGHDDQFWSRAVRFAKFKHIGGVVYKRRQHTGSLTQARVDRQMANRARIIKEMLAAYPWRDLIPEIGWGQAPDKAVEGAAHLRIAAGLVICRDFDAAIEHVRISAGLYPQPLIGRFLQHIEGERDRIRQENEIANGENAVVKEPVVTEKPFFSIGIIVYNAERFIGDAIRSALKQDYDLFEVVIIDDGSTDGTTQVVKSFEDERIHYFRRDHKGAPAARNAAIAEAKGDFIVWLDADDLLLPKTLSLYAETLAKYPDAEVIYCDWINADENLKLIGPQRFTDWFGKRGELIGKLLWETVLPNGGTMLRKSLFSRIGGYDESFLSCHDDQFWARAADTTVFKHCGGAVYKRRQHTGSLTRGRTDKQNLYHPRIVKELIERYDLRLLLTDIPWGKMPEKEAFAAARTRIAERFLQRLAWDEALEQLRISYTLHPNPGTAQAIAQVEALAGKTHSNGNGNGNGRHVHRQEPLSSHPAITIPPAAIEVAETPSSDFGGTPAEPFVSIIIPTYNRARSVGDAVESALKQSYPHFEVVVVDDGSTDKTLEILARYSDPHLRVIHAEHLGGPAARNRGIREATGEFILWLDSDDLLLPKAIRSQVDGLNKRLDADVVYGDLIMVDDNLKLIKAERYEEWAGREADLIPRLFWGDCIPNGGTLVRKSLFGKVGGYDDSFPMAHDYHFWSRAVTVAKFKHSGATIYKYRRYSENVSPEKAARYRKFDAMVANSMLDNIPLNRLLPAIGWGRIPENQAIAAAAKVAVDRLVGLGDLAGAARWAMKAHEAFPSSQSERLIQTLTTMQGGKKRVRHNGPVKVIAIMAAFNEGDVIRAVIGDLIANGVEVYLIDNHSTDNTVAEASVWLGKGLIGIEDFPPEGSTLPSGCFQLAELMRRKEELGATLDADWFINADADEVREAPFPGWTLREGIEHADRLGYNAIAFDLFNFRPTEDNFPAGGDVRDYLTHYERAEAFDLDQVRAWKNTGLRINLAATAGHEAMFPERRIYPIPFILRHYPIRGETHGRKKIFGDRIPRFTDEERAKGWHVQYDEFKTKPPEFLYQPEALTKWDGATVRQTILSRAIRDMMFVQVLQGAPDPNKLNGDALMRNLEEQLGYDGELSTDAVRLADQALTAHFNSIMAGEPRPAFPNDDLTLRLIFLLSRIKSAVSSQSGAYKAAAIWEAVGRKAGEIAMGQAERGTAKESDVGVSQAAVGSLV